MKRKLYVKLNNFLSEISFVFFQKLARELDELEINIRIQINQEYENEVTILIFLKLINLFF
jgi:hypothetical protein